jgi:D-alanine-D-alanine ligase
MSDEKSAGGWLTLAQYRDLAREKANNIAVMVVANVVENKGGATDTSDRSTEYFSESELEQIVFAFRSFGFYCDIFFGESDFIRWVEGGGPKHFPGRSIVIYSAAQSGTGAGRKSLVPAICALHGLKFVNSDPYATSLARHKFHCNAILSSLQISVPKCWWYLESGEWLDGNLPPQGARIITKSTYESASIGIGADALKTYNASAQVQIAALAKQLNQGVVVQEFIEGSEAETPVISGASRIAIGPAGISIDNDRNLGSQFLDYDRVYADKYEFYDFSAEKADCASELRELAVRAAAALGLGGFSRVDFRISREGKPYVTDISTTPHLVEHSAYSFCFQAAGWSRADMVGLLVGLTLAP